MRFKLIFAFLILTSYIYGQSGFDIEGHRGCRGLYPENTIVAFIEAVKLGVNTLEMDVVITKDGKLVISHDPVMNEDICSTPDGKPVTAATKQNYKIYELTYEEVKKFDCGLRGNPKFPEQKKVAAYKPLLSDVIDTVEHYIQEHHLPAVYYNIETKSTVAGDDIYHPKPAVFSKMLYDLIKQKGVLRKCIIQSFDVRTLQEVRKLDATVTTALLVENVEGFKKNIAKLGFYPDIYSPYSLLVNKKLIKNCHAHNIKVIPWTVNDESKMVNLQQLGVDGIISDYPDKAIKVLKK